MMRDRKNGGGRIRDYEDNVEGKPLHADAFNAALAEGARPRMGSQQVGAQHLDDPLKLIAKITPEAGAPVLIPTRRGFRLQHGRLEKVNEAHQSAQTLVDTV